MNSPPCSPPRPDAGDDIRDSDDNCYIDVHDGSCTLLKLPPLKTMDEILSNADASMNRVTETYHVQGDINNYKDHTPANSDTAEKHPETKPKSSLGCQRLQPTGKRSGSNNHSKMAWGVVPKYFENGMIKVKGHTERITTDYPGLLEKMEISGGIAKQIHDWKAQLHQCELNGKQPGAGALKHDLKELSKQLVGFTTSP
ncbi:hypothetical protein BDD12DRAFT_900057 [Trichophaea hybrida]|nr:hypothetical protein BDD12DRAFT_900057 [Trichophaea hybrida]